jgi:hypothetical protein
MTAFRASRGNVTNRTLAGGAGNEFHSILNTSAEVLIGKDYLKLLAGCIRADRKIRG